MKQIEQGAPADVFLSADIDWMDYGIKHNLIKNDTRENLLGNCLVLIAPKDSKIGSVTIAPGSILRRSPAPDALRPAMCARFRLASMPKQPWRSSASGQASNQK